MVRLAFIGCGLWVLSCGGSSSGDSTNDSVPTGSGGTGGEATRKSVGGEAGTGGASAGGTAGGSTATHELDANAGTLCEVSCEKAAQCDPDGIGDLATCEGHCLESLSEAARSEECARLMLAALDCMLAAECADLDASCDRAFEEASRCAGGGGRTCSSGLPASPEAPSPGDPACSQSCEATSTLPAQSVECVHAETELHCTCTEDGATSGEVEADSCDAAYDLCFR